MFEWYLALPSIVLIVIVLVSCIATGSLSLPYILHRLCATISRSPGSIMASFCLHSRALTVTAHLYHGTMDSKYLIRWNRKRLVFMIKHLCSKRRISPQPTSFFEISYHDGCRPRCTTHHLLLLSCHQLDTHTPSWSRHCHCQSQVVCRLPLRSIS